MAFKIDFHTSGQTGSREEKKTNLAQKCYVTALGTIT